MDTTKDIQTTKTPIPNTDNIYSQSELNRIRVFKFIEENQPVSQYAVHKKLGIAYNTTYYIIRDLIFSGVVHTEKKINKDGTEYNQLTIPKIPEIISADKINEGDDNENN